MAKIKTSELTGKALDWAVCEATGLFAAYPKVKKNFLKMWQGNSSYYLHPSTDWAQGGPIIEREGVELKRNMVPPILWAAFTYNWTGLQNKSTGKTGPTPLIAAMRCYVASKLGDEVEVPDALS